MRLVIDSSSSRVWVGLFSDDGEWVFVKSLDEGVYEQSKLLFRMIQDCLAENDIESSEIKSLGVGIGPGSYTGLRVGLTLAKVWSFSKNIPLYSFSSSLLSSATDSEQSSSVDLTQLGATDFVKVENIDDIEPIYKNDHFDSKKTSEQPKEDQ
jgi:tRNA threonylcarbamoyladenosine biosynthesis protein TsaB